MHLLLVDDETPLLNLLSQHLIRKGHTVEAAVSVADAKAMLAGQFRAAILDWTLPDGTGLEIGRELFKRDPLIQLVFTSGYPLDWSFFPNEMTNHVRVLQKPFLPRALLDILSSL